jgi:hypothetical protein
MEHGSRVYATDNASYQSGRRRARSNSGSPCHTTQRDGSNLAVAKRLVTDAGYEPAVVDGLSTAKKLDQGAPVYPKAMLASDIRAALNLK